MLRDYFWSLTLVALILIAYTALVVLNKKPGERLPSAIGAAMPAPGTGPSSAASTP